MHGLVLMVLMGVFLMLWAAEKGVSEKAAPLLLLMFEFQLRVQLPSASASPLSL